MIYEDDILVNTLPIDLDSNYIYTSILWIKRNREKESIIDSINRFDPILLMKKQIISDLSSFEDISRNYFENLEGKLQEDFILLGQGEFKYEFHNNGSISKGLFYSIKDKNLPVIYNPFNSANNSQILALRKIISNMVSENILVNEIYLNKVKIFSLQKLVLEPLELDFKNL